jgi:hypothetical protein
VARAARAARVAQAPVDPVDPAAPGGRAIRVAPADMNRVVATEATGRADMTPAAQVAPAAQVGRADMNRVDPADLASPGDTILADLATPEVTTRVGLEDMTRERPGVQSRAVHCRADLAMPGDTILVGRALLGRMPVRRDRMPVHRPLTAEPQLRTRAHLHPTAAEPRLRTRAHPHLTQAEVATRPEAATWAAATRPVDRTLRLEAIRPVGATPRRK